MKKPLVNHWLGSNTRPAESAVSTEDGCIKVFYGLDEEVWRTECLFNSSVPAADALKPLSPTSV